MRAERNKSTLDMRTQMRTGKNGNTLDTENRKTGRIKIKIKMKFIAGLLAVMSICMPASGCGKKEEPVLPKPEPAIDETLADDETGFDDVLDEEDTHEGQARSFLTGEWIDQKLARKRPVSCMIGNTDSALPQYGIGQADVIYEAPVEGGLTRLMGIFQDYENLKQLGSVRSGRLYFAYYSMGFDAIYLHYGQASYAQGFLESGQIDDLNCMEQAVDSAVIWRDNSKRAPHNAYAAGERLVKGVELKQYDTKYKKDYAGTYLFAEDDAPVELTGDSCQEAGVVQPGYLSNQPYFEYQPKDGLYYRYQYGGRQIDGTDGSHLAVKNIIMQNAGVRVLDDNGYLEITTTGSGDGWYITNGKAERITWECADNFSPTHYYDGSGKEITLNQGKTWVCVVDDAHLDRVHIYEDSAQVQ